MQEVRLIATAAFGLEAVVARELKDLGFADQAVENGRVLFKSDLAGIAKANLWLRSADRVQLLMGEFEARSFEELFEKTKALPWEDWIPLQGEFPVQGKSVKSQLHSVPDCQAIVKKAVVERLKQKYKVQWFEETGPRYSIQVALLKDRVTLTVDTSGAGLHKRGYREGAGEAPIKETLAAALVQLSHWRPGRLLLDPLCGSGTVLIEAALLGDNIAPGLTRRFAAEDWPVLGRSLWTDARAEASAQIQDNPLELQGSDIDGRVLALARSNADNAGVGDKIHFQRRALGEVRSSRKYGCVITNPPYGERLEDADNVQKLYQEMGRIFAPWDTWSIYVLTSSRDFEKHFGRRADRKRKLYNGRIQCDYYQFIGPPPPRPKEDENA
ncbi:MAG: THUMP domain-containing class I SAM-dependent RNA methyltransferase [Bacillota bacterium]|jgi:putative N6-adenine-specific DNA methylase